MQLHQQNHNLLTPGDGSIDYAFRAPCTNRTPRPMLTTTAFTMAL